jgi:hypothetical protein
MSEDRMTDGADKRRRRVMDLLHEMKTQDGMTLLEIQGFMMSKFSLKFDTTAKYLQEMHLAGMVKDTGRKWKVHHLRVQE